MRLITISIFLLGFLFGSTGFGQDLRTQIEILADRIADKAHTSAASDFELEEVIAKLNRSLRILNSGGSEDELFCEPRSSSYSYVTRVSDGHRFGTDDVSNSLCQQIIANVKNGLVCGPRSSSYAFVMNVKTGATLGTDEKYLPTCAYCYERELEQ